MEWGVAYSGAVNKIDYEKYAACVKPNNGTVSNCSAQAGKNQYVEAALNNNIYNHYHFLRDSYGNQQYVYR